MQFDGGGPDPDEVGLVADPLLGPLRDALAASPRWWAEVFDTAGIGMVVVAEDGELLGVTPSLAAMLGYTREELLAAGVEGVSHPDDMAEDLRHYRDLVAGRTDRYQLDKRYRRADGSTMWGRLTVVAVAAPRGEGRWFVGMVQDITDRKETEQRLRRFIAEASHELRTPVAVVQGIARLLLDDADVEVGDLHAMLHRHSDHLAALLSRLLDLSRAEGRTTTVEPVDLSDVVDDVVGQLAVAGDGDLMLGIEGPLPVLGDRVGLGQVVTNLVTNARRHGEPPIEIRAWEENHTVVLVVRDHGEGLSGDTLDQLFQPFAAGAKGVGLGLAITRASIEGMGGMIWYEDADPGARFLIRLQSASSDDARRRRAAPVS